MNGLPLAEVGVPVLPSFAPVSAASLLLAVSPTGFLVIVTPIAGSFSELGALAEETGWFSARLVSCVSISVGVKPAKVYGEQREGTSLPEARLEEGNGE